MCFKNLLCMCTLMSWELGRSYVVDFGCIAMREFQNAALFLPAPGATGMVWFRSLATRLRAHLVVRCNQFCDGVVNTCPCELTGTGYIHEIQPLLHFPFHQHSLFLCRFLCLYNLPGLPWYCPVINRYICFHTPLFVDLVMLTKMLTTRGISPLVEGLPLSLIKLLSSLDQRPF